VVIFYRLHLPTCRDRSVVSLLNSAGVPWIPPPQTKTLRTERLRRIARMLRHLQAQQLNGVTISDQAFFLCFPFPPFLFLSFFTMLRT
jgi:hypothetical protein